MSVPRPPRNGRSPGEHDVTTSIGTRPRAEQRDTSPTSPNHRADQPAVGQPRSEGRDGGQPQGSGGRLTRTARSQRSGVVATAPGARSGERTRRREGSPPASASPHHTRVGQRRPGPTQGGTGEPGHSDRCVRGKAHGPQPAAQARAGPASQVTARPDKPPRSQRPDLSSDKSPEDSVSATTRWPKIQTQRERYTHPGGQGVESPATPPTQKCATRTSVPKKATIAATHGAPRAVSSTPRPGTPSGPPVPRRGRPVPPERGPFGRPLTREGHTRDRRRSQGPLSDYERGLGRKVSQQRDRSRVRHPGRTARDGHRLPTRTWKRDSAGASGGQGPHRPATGPGRGVPGHPRHARRVPAGRGSGLGSYGVLVDQPRQPPHLARAWKLGDSLPLYSPARPCSDSQVTRQRSGATGTAPLTAAGFPELCLAHSRDAPLARQLPPELWKPGEPYKSGHQMEPENRRHVTIPNLSPRHIRMAGRPADRKTETVSRESLPEAENTDPPPQPHRNAPPNVYLRRPRQSQKTSP